MIIYQLTNRLNGKRYIGQTVHTLERRVRSHVRDRRSRTAISNALRKYGLKGFDCRVLVQVDSLEELNYYEEALVRLLKTQRPHGYNITIGGESKTGFKHTPGAIEKIREASTGRKHTEEAKAKISRTRLEKGFRHTQEVLDKISQSRKGQMTGEKHPMYGKTHSDEAKQKISAAGKGRRHSDEARQKFPKHQKRCGNIGHVASHINRALVQKVAFRGTRVTPDSDFSKRLKIKGVKLCHYNHN